MQFTNSQKKEIEIKLQYFATALDNLKRQGLVILALSDDEIIFEMNKFIPPDYKISLSYYKKIIYSYSQMLEEDNLMVHIDKEIFQKLEEAIKHFIIDLKKLCFQEMLDDEKGGSRYMWILERRFKDWNLKLITASEENKPKERKLPSWMNQKIQPIEGNRIFTPLESNNDDPSSKSES